MKLQPVTDGLQALQTFLEDYELTAVVKAPAHTQRLRTIYRRYHALLTWHAYLAEKKPANYKKDDSFPTFLLYLNECVSDTCQAIFLWNQGLYKPSHLVLRSGIENFFRSIGLFEGQAVLAIGSTFELARVIRETNLVQETSVATAQFERLWRAYGELCKYVHTSDEYHMSLTTAVGVFPRFEQEKASESAVEIRACTTAYCALLCLMFPVRYRQFHHTDYDLVSDILPKGVRQRLGGHATTKKSP